MKNGVPGIYCSRRCAAYAREQRRGAGQILNLHCDFCGKDFARPKSVNDNGIKAGAHGKFCSHGCYSKARKGPRVERVTLVCPMCHNQFTRVAAQVRRDRQSGKAKEFFCSRDCRSSYYRASLPISLIQEYKDGKTSTKLAEENHVSAFTILEFLRSHGVEIRDKNSYLTSQWAREREYLRIANGDFPIVSSIENTVANELDSLGITYERQKVIFYQNRPVACVDFSIGSSTVLEVNGTYYHCDPRAYPNGPINHNQEQMVKRYNRKIGALKKAGFQVIEIWEIDLKNDASHVVKAAIGK
ncbi:MAG TPA: hypothetical protein VGB77_12815 [Abditibacteriaceae bacterium]